MIEILFRNEEVVVVDKPSGLLTHRSAMASETEVAMTQARDAVGQHVWTVHRLDRATSGALAFALSEGSARALGQAFEAGEVEKVYVALVRGVVPESVLVDHPVPRGEGKARVPATTAFRRLYADPKERFSVVEARPVSGRFHQIRRHLSHLRHPIAGDTNYGTGWFNRWLRTEALLPRLALHALSIELPLAEGRKRVTSSLAHDFAAALERLEVDGSLVASLRSPATH